MSGIDPGTSAAERVGPERATLRWATAIAALCAGGYANALGNDFLLDDHVVVFGPKGVANLTLADLLHTRQHFFYRPVGHVFLLLCHRLFGERAELYHAANLALLLSIVALTYRLALALGVPTRPAALASALFAVHPLHAFLVDYVTASVIATFVLLLQASFLAYLRYRATGSVLAQAASLLAFTGALLSHEMALVLPAVIAAYVWIRLGDSLADGLRECVAHLLLAAGYLALRALAFPLTASVGSTLFALRDPLRFLASLWDLLAWYVPKLVWPDDLLFLWSAPYEPTHALPKALGLLLALGAVLGWVLARRRRSPLSAFLVAMFAAGLVPFAAAAFTYFPQSSPLVEPHWFYFPAIGLFLLAGLALDRLWRTRGARLAVAAFAAVLVAHLTLLVETNSRWRNEETYSRYWLSLNDRDWTPYHGIGRALLRRGEYGSAAAVLRQGVERIPRAVPSVLAADLGYAAYRAGQEAEGSWWLARALQNDPGYAQIWHHLGLIAIERGDMVSAQRYLERAASLFPRSEEYRRDLERLRQQVPTSSSAAGGDS